MIYRADPHDGVAWVTGASSGIGRATALELARRGYTVAVTARPLSELEALAVAGAGGRGRIVAHEGDVTDARGLAGIIDIIERVHGPIVLAFLNAGAAPDIRTDPLDLDAFRRAFEINLFGVVNGLAPLLARMAERGRGQIAVDGSVAGKGGLPGGGAYGASKAALINLCEALKLDCERLGITIQIVNPGLVDTPLTRRNGASMPFLMPHDEAARRICDAFERGGFEIALPRRLSAILKLVGLMPYPLYFRAVARAAGWRGPDP